MEQWVPLREFFKLEKDKSISKASKGSKGQHTRCTDRGKTVTSSAKSVKSSPKSISSSTKTVKSSESSVSTNANCATVSSTKSVSSKTTENASGANASFDLNSYLFSQQKIQEKKNRERKKNSTRAEKEGE